MDSFLEDMEQLNEDRRILLGRPRTPETVNSRVQRGRSTSVADWLDEPKSLVPSSEEKLG